MWYSCYHNCCEKINSFRGFAYIFWTQIFFGTPSNGHFHKANKNFRSFRQPNIQLMLQKNRLKMLIIKHRFNSAKCFLTNYSNVWCVTLIPGYPNDINWRCFDAIIDNFGHIQYLVLVFLLSAFNKKLSVMIPDHPLYLSNMSYNIVISL